MALALAFGSAAAIALRWIPSIHAGSQGKSRKDCQRNGLPSSQEAVTCRPLPWSGSCQSSPSASSGLAPLLHDCRFSDGARAYLEFQRLAAELCVYFKSSVLEKARSPRTFPIALLGIQPCLEPMMESAEIRRQRLVEWTFSQSADLEGSVLIGGLLSDEALCNSATWEFVLRCSRLLPSTTTQQFAADFPQGYAMSPLTSLVARCNWPLDSACATPFVLRLWTLAPDILAEVVSYLEPCRAAVLRVGLSRLISAPCDPNGRARLLFAMSGDLGPTDASWLCDVLRAEADVSLIQAVVCSLWRLSPETCLDEILRRFGRSSRSIDSAMLTAALSCTRNCSIGAAQDLMQWVLSASVDRSLKFDAVNAMSAVDDGVNLDGLIQIGLRNSDQELQFAAAQVGVRRSTDSELREVCRAISTR